MSASSPVRFNDEEFNAILCRLDGDLPPSDRAQTVREVLQQVVGAEDRLQLRIAELLFEVQEKRYWRDWGFGSFKDFVKSECTFKLRKAQQLVEVYRRFVVELEVPPEQMRRMEWSKAALVAPVLNKDNRDDFLEKLTRLSYRELQTGVEKIREDSARPTVTPGSPPPASHARPASGTNAGGPASAGWRLLRPAEDEFYVAEDVWEQLCFGVGHGEHVLLTGPSGCGKSEICYLLAKAAGKRIEAFNFGAMTEPRTSLIGNTHLDRRNGTWFQESRFVRAVQDPEACVLLDELSRAGRDAFNILLPLLDGQGYLALDEREDAAVVRRVRGLSFLATANLGMEFTGTETLDRALLDRFPIAISVDFPPPERELAILRKRCHGLAEASAKRLLKVAQRQRDLARDGEFVGTVSTRALLAAGRQVAAGIPVERAFRFCILQRFSAEGGDASERSRLMQIFQKG